MAVSTSKRETDIEFGTLVGEAIEGTLLRFSLPIRLSESDLCCDRSAFDRNPLKTWAPMANKSTQKQWKARVENSSAPSIVSS
jgi:hypothetical protein